VNDISAVAPLLAALSDRLRKAGAASVRANPLRLHDDDGGLAAALAASGFQPVSDDDYGVTLEVAIDTDREALLASFPKGTRYSIRQAMKAGVLTDRAESDEDIRALNDLYASMVERKGATPRPPGFFRAIAEFLEADPSRGFVHVSRHERQIVGSIVVTRYGNRALYTFGASKDADDGIPKMYLGQFEAMVAARSLGCTVYDLGGFSAGVGEEGSRSAAQGINFFKSRFTKTAVTFMPCHERVLRPLLHRLVEGARRLSGVPPAGAGKAAP
jgi:lipid II:glycine glycyltransferase (peptidoglycan interpeptide bridge formation enzyme)